MKFINTTATGTVLVLALLAGTGCSSEIDNKTAAEVAEVQTGNTDTTTTTSNAPGGPVEATPVIKETSSIGFIGAKVTRDHVGTFKTFDGSIEYVGQQPNRILFEIEPGSAVTDSLKLDAHLKSADFFDVANHPKATFTSQNVREEIGADGSTHRVDGILSLRGVEKAISFPVKVERLPDAVRATAEFTINRKDWNVAYAGAADDLIKDDVLIKLDLHFPPPPSA